jgi:anoctamin-10
LTKMKEPTSPNSLSPTFKDNDKGTKTNMETDYIIVFRFAKTSESNIRWVSSRSNRVT